MIQVLDTRGMFKNLLGNPNARKLKRFQPLIKEINLLEEDIKQLDDTKLAAKTAEFKEQLEKGKTESDIQEILDDLLPEAFAVVREAAQRVLGMRHYDVQLLGVSFSTKDKLLR